MTQTIEDFIADLRQALLEDPAMPSIGVGLEDLTDNIGIDGHISLRFVAEWLVASGYRKEVPPTQHRNPFDWREPAKPSWLARMIQSSRPFVERKAGK